MRSLKTRDFSGIKTEDLETMLAAGSNIYPRNEQERIRSELAKRSQGVTESGGEWAGLPWQREEAVIKRKILLTFRGRLSRLRYFLSSFLSFFATVVIVVVAVLASHELIKLFAALAVIYLVVVEFSAAARRFHDLNKSGLWFMLLSIPIVNVFVGFYLLFKKGTEGPNRFGPDPLNRA